jgi:hypothetical protein
VDKGKNVFPNLKFAAAITNQGLEGLLLPVTIKFKENRGVPHYVAYTNNLKCVPHHQKIEWETIPSALLIDGQNLLGGVKAISQLALDEAVQRIQDLAPIKRAKMFFCADSGQSRSEWMDQVSKLKRIELVNRTPKYLNGRTIRKEVDIDALMLPEIPYLKFDTSIRGLIVVTGDSDYEKALQMWAGVGQYHKTGRRPLMIISAAGHLSKELRALGNYPNIEVVELENLV